MDAILQTFLNGFLWKKICVSTIILIKISFKFAPSSPTDKESATRHWLWKWLGTKQAQATMMTQYTDTYIFVLPGAPFSNIDQL